MAAPVQEPGSRKPRGLSPRRTRATSSRPRRAEAERLSLGTILNLVRLHGPLTRLELERLSGLRRAVVTERLNALIRLGLVREGERGKATGGRAPRLVEFRADAALILVAAIDAGRLGVGLTDLTGRLVTEHHEALELAVEREQIGKRLIALFDWILEQHKRGRDVWGIGLALAGRAEAVSIAPSSGPGRFGEGPLAAQLAQHVRAPVSPMSGVQLRTLGEWRSGGTNSASNLMFVDLGSEISAGLLSEGRLHRGAEGAAGMIGHVAVTEEGGPICRCGNSGCLEALAGADAIVREASRAARDGRSSALAEVLAAEGQLTVADIGAAAQRGDAFSAELLSRCGRLIGTVLAAIVNAFNPALVVLGGEIAETGDIVLAAIREAIYRRSHHLATRDLTVIRSRMGSSAALVGSALALLDELFAPEFLKEWIGLGTPLRHPRVQALVPQAGGHSTGARPAIRTPSDSRDSTDEREPATDRRARR